MSNLPINESHKNLKSQKMETNISTTGVSPSHFANNNYSALLHKKSNKNISAIYNLRDENNCTSLIIT